MRTRIWRVLIAAGLLFGLTPSAQAQVFQLLAPDVGWTVGYGQRVLWTNDGGRDWKDITPPTSADADGAGAFFLDTQRGWVLLPHGEPDEGLQFDLARTDNAGATWSMKHVTLPQGAGPFRGGDLAFADQLHGWLGLQAGMSAGIRGAGELFATSDGGETWTLTTAPAIGPMLMVTPQEGWLVGGGGNEPLIVTRDGAKTWQKIDLESPVKTDQMREYDKTSDAFWSSFERAIPPGAARLAAKRPQHEYYAAYDLPTFKDPEHGYVCVTYPGLVVLFETADGGATWKPDRVVTGLRPHQSGTKEVSAIADSTWIIGRAPQNGPPQLSKFAPGARVTDNTMPAPEESGISEMSFITASQGWVFTVYGRLLSTTDGGATWTDITPGRNPQAATP